MIPVAYRTLLRDRRTRRLLAGLGASSLGDGLSTVTIAWLAVSIAPAGEVGLFAGCRTGNWSGIEKSPVRNQEATPTGWA